jgi:hypothetical protein
MITHDQLNLLWNIEVACQWCIRAAHYFDVASNSKSNMWSFTQNCYGGICVIHWCQVFGAKSEPTHYSKLFGVEPLAGMSKNRTEERLRQSTGMDKIIYKQLWNETKKARDKFLVHNEFNSKETPIFPDLDVLIKVCCEMRNIISDIVTLVKSDDPKKQADIAHFVTHFTNEMFLAEIQKETHVLVQAMSRS